MIRGKKNYLPQTALVFGFGILYKVNNMHYIIVILGFLKVDLKLDGYFECVEITKCAYSISVCQHVKLYKALTQKQTRE